MTVKTRFAPSPTGFLHVGGVRTALFSWLFAKHHHGEFYLRIEDTDQTRSTQESVEVILDGMSWLGLSSDGPIVYQTKRYDRYHEILENLLDRGLAYHCHCSKDRLEGLREAQLAAKEKPRYDGHCREKNLPAKAGVSVIRFKNPVEGTVKFVDHVYGDIHINNAELDDLILLRSDNHPTYNFSVVVDDMDMAITHVIRGDDHINNTPRQINLYQALNATPPEFAHLPMILGEDGKRLSKRHGAVSVLEFKKMGVLPEALLNYLVRLGWSAGDQEIFSLDEMISQFSLDKVSRGASSFNYEKLYWLNQHYIRTLQESQIMPALQYQFDELGVNTSQGPELSALISVYADRCATLHDIASQSTIYYADSVSYDDSSVKKHLRPVVLDAMVALRQAFAQTSQWERNQLQEIVNDICVRMDMNMAKVAQPLRVAVTGSSSSPAIDQTLELIGKERTLQRLDTAIQIIEQRAAQQN
ncbi:glutamate--tRNA ligase [Legionella sp. W05-934-2]|uniref:glutamate--tRNA ligase n=1 Tax=Legionella sp. W05-934-2 TaxID=1198649 RepID=UPI0034625083